MDDSQNKNGKRKDYLLPGSILVAALLISISLVYSAGKKSSGNDDLSANLGGVAAPKINPSPVNVKPITDRDHILGNKDAQVKVIEFSDLECPFCKSFHPTMKRALEVYGDKVAWVYRHFPIDSRHPKARKEAEASECAAELGGNQKFWTYVDRLFEVTPSNNGLDLNKLPQIAADVGLDRTKFESCLNSGKYASRIEEDAKDAVNSGGGGTPYSIVLAKSGKKYIIPGAIPFEAGAGEPSVKVIIDQALEDK